MFATILMPRLPGILSPGAVVMWRSTWIVLSGLSVIAVFSIVLLLGPGHIQGPWDVFILLEGGWRIFIGQIPHTDFYNPIGPLSYAMIAVGMYIHKPSLAAYVYGNLVFLAIVASWGAVVFFRKLPPPFACLLTLFIAVLIAAARPLGWDPALTTYAMIYNRYAWALIAILFIQLFIPAETVSTRNAAFDAGSSGLLLGLIFFCKINFFVGALVAVVLAAVLRPELRGRIVLMVTMFLVVCLGFRLLAGVNPLAYARDMAFAARSQSLTHRLSWLRHSLRVNALNGLLIGAMWWYLIGRPTIRRQRSWMDAIKITLVLGCILGSAAFITVGNWLEQNDVPLFLVAGIILLDAWRRKPTVSAARPNPTERWPYVVSSLIVVGVFFGGIFVKDVLSLTYARSGREDTQTVAAKLRQFEAANLGDFVIPSSDFQTAYSRTGDVPGRINDGLALLRRHVSPRSRLAVLGLTDPFSFALGLTPPRGAPLWWDLNISFNSNHYPRAERVFSEADLVMYPVAVEPKDGCCWETVSALHELYDRYLTRHYAEVDRSKYWVLLERHD